VEARAAALAAACREADGLRASLAAPVGCTRSTSSPASDWSSCASASRPCARPGWCRWWPSSPTGSRTARPARCAARRPHPDPYLGDGDAVTRDDEDRARAAAEGAAREVAAVEARVAAEAAVTVGHRERLVDAGQPTSSRRSCGSSRPPQRPSCRCCSRSRRLDDATAVLSALEREAGRLESEQVGLAADREAGARRAAEAGGRAQQAADRLRGELDGAADLDTALVDTARRAAACDAALDAVEEAVRASREAARAAATAVSAAEAAGHRRRCGSGGGAHTAVARRRPGAAARR
jgi:exonuclease SbcC